MSIQNIAKQVFSIEAQAIEALSGRIDEKFEKAVRLLADCQGRVIVCGMGKSGLVGKKLSATLSSTGTASYFLHPSDALHGDLGVLMPNDCLITISNSGETDEILRLIPHVERLGLPHITLVGKPESTLARHAQIVLNIGVSQEAAPLSAVPMASVAATLAMGDALAAALIHLKNFQQADFALLHPAGTLGHKVVTKVQEAMRSHDLPVVARHDNIQEVIMKISAGMLGTAAVCDSHQYIIGVITDGDLRRALNRHPNAAFFALEAEMIMSPEPKTVHPNQSLLDAETLMLQHKISTLLVADESRKLLGMLAKHFIK